MCFYIAKFKTLRSNSIAILSFENLALSKSFQLDLPTVETTFAGMSFLMKSISPSPFLFQSIQNGIPKPSKKNRKNHLLSF